MTNGADATEEWREFVDDAASALSYTDDIAEVGPALIDDPFNPRFQEHMRRIVDADRTRRANLARDRITGVGEAG